MKQSRKRKRRWLMLLTLLASWHVLPIQAETVIPSEPVQTDQLQNQQQTTQTRLGPVDGERLVFNLHWMGFPAGISIMKFKQPSDDSYDIDVTLDSIGAVDFFFQVKDRLQAKGRIVDNALRSDYYLKSQKEDDLIRYAESKFDRTTNEVVFTERKNGKKSGKNRVVKDIPVNVNDPISSFYGLRLLKNLQPQSTVKVPIIDGGKWYNAEVRVGKAQRIYTPMGWFDAMPVYPQLKTSKLFRLKGQLIIWLTNDERRLPLRVEAQVKIGAVAIDLTEFQDGRGGSGKIVEEVEDR
ncbi:MAG: DUF3108 domain-containing protein [Magnetococcales bacterium]|nr:DUF3108 domain-containing protein [Magnetococcales bacterium]